MSYPRLRLNSLIIAFCLAIGILLPHEGVAGVIELSGSFSYSSSSYGSTGLEWKRSWDAAIGYYLSDLTEIELSMEDTVNRSMLQGVEDTTFHDQLYSFEIVQSLLPKSVGFQPFVKAGVGQLLREATGTYSGGVVAPAVVMGSLTGILGGGLRVFLHRQFSVKAEVTTYLQDGQISTWQNNFLVHFGCSLYF